MCAYEQVGDFTVTHVNGQVQKNGGNVAGYFCTPEGYVLNAVVGPVSAQKLLQEAEWAVRVEGELGKEGGDWSRDSAIVAAAHQSQLGDAVHVLLAIAPMAPLPAIQSLVFGLGNERITTGRGAVQLAAARLRTAEEQGLPVLFVLTEARVGAEDPALLVQGEAARLLKEFEQPPLRGAVQNCMVIVLPIDQLAAMSSLTRLPAFDLAERTTPTMVLADCHGKQLQAIRRSTPAPSLANTLWSIVNRERFLKAQQLLANHDDGAAKRILGMLQATPFVFPEKAVARRQWETLKAGRHPQPEAAPSG